jgi:hypothetical protein
LHIKAARLITRGARVLALAAIMIARAAAADDDAVREYVDEITAVSITVPVESLLFARERTDLAANARDYITLTPLEINRTGQRACYWFGYVWSTIDRPIAVLEGDELVLLADGRPIALRWSAASCAIWAWASRRRACRSRRRSCAVRGHVGSCVRRTRT